MSTTMLPPAATGPAASVATADGRPERRVAETGVWIAIATISMSFAALTSALVVRQSSGADWQHLHLPSLLYVNTLVLVASSFTLEWSTSSPPPHDNFGGRPPVVTHGPNEFGGPGPRDYVMQAEPR